MNPVPAARIAVRFGLAAVIACCGPLVSVVAVADWPAHGPDKDYVIPDRRVQVRPGSADGSVLPLSLEGGGDPARPGQSTPASHDGLRVDQSFEQSHVLAGERMETELTVTVTHSGDGVRSGIELYLYFIRQDMEVLEAPACRKREVDSGSGPQPVLACTIEGDLAPGQRRGFSVIVRADASRSQHQAGDRLFSTACDQRDCRGLRHDAWVNVVRDVLGDGADEGLSAFNRERRAQTPTDIRGRVVIDVMALYTPAARQQSDSRPEKRINRLIDRANQVYADSGVGITLRPVHHRQVDASTGQDGSREHLLEQLTDNDDPFADVESWRHRYGADVVILFVPRDGQESFCGLANLGGHNTHGDFTSFNEADYAYSLVAIDCPVPSVVAHEVGHNMGLTHSRREDGQGGTFPWATGHGVDSRFVTAMASPSAFGDADRRALFSSPGLDCLDGLACGVDRSDPNRGADAVSTLNTVKYQIAAYQPTQVEPPPGLPLARSNGGGGDARIALAVSAEQSPSHTDRVETGEVIDLSAEFYPDPDHVGAPGQFHVLFQLGPGGEFIQLTDSGRQQSGSQLPSIDELLAFNGTSELRTRESLSILEGFRVPADLAGRTLHIYTAYRVVSDSGRDELVYTQQPAVLRIMD